MALSSARALLAGIRDEVALSVVHVLEGLTLPRPEALERAKDASRGAALERLAARILRSDMDASPSSSDAESRAEAAGALEIGPRAEWFRRGGEERVDLTRRPKLRMLLDALLEKRLASPGDPAQAEWLVSRVWPQEKILPSAASSRLYVAVATLRKLGMGDVIVTRGEGYLLHPAIELLDARKPAGSPS